MNLIKKILTKKFLTNQILIKKFLTNKSRLCKILLKKKKTKSENRLMKGIKNFLKKK